MTAHASLDDQPRPGAILLIESDTTLAQSMKAELTRQGFKVVEANTHLKALSILEDRKDLELILVMAEPTDIGGFDFIHLLRHRNRFAERWLQVIVITSGESFEGFPANAAGIDDYLLRPYFPGELAWRANKAIQRVRSRRIQCADHHLEQSAGIYSPASLEKALHEELNKMCRTHGALSLVIFQPQGLEAIRLSHGLMMTEWMERDFAEAIRASLRIYDRLGKLEGDRYCLIAPDVDSTHLPLLVGRLVQRIQDWNKAVASHSPIRIPMTLSLRAVTVVAEHRPHHLNAAVAALWNWICRTYAESWPESEKIVNVRLTKQGTENLAPFETDCVTE